ncbi:uncharacterized protein LOC141881835 isoform X3 [Acropora palmata]
MVSFEQDQFLWNSVVTTAEDMGDNATRGLTFMQRLGRMCKVSFIDRRQIGQLSSILKIFDFCNLLNSVKRCLHHKTIHNSKLMSFHRIMTPSFSEHQQSFSSLSKSFASIIKHSLETLLNFLISTYFFAIILMITMRWERSRSLKRFGGHCGDPASLSIESFSSKTYGIFFILLSISTTGSCTVTVLSSEHTSINPSCTTMKQSSFRNTNVNQSASTSNFSGEVSTVVKRTAIMLSKSLSLCQKKSDATYRATTDRAGLVVINSKTSITSSSSYLAEHITRLPSPSFYYRHSRLERDNSTRQIYPTMSLFTIRNEESYYSDSVDESKAATHDQIPQTDSRNLIVGEVSSNQSFTLASVFTWPSSRFTRMSASSPAFIAFSSKGLLNTATLSTIHVDSVNQMVSSLAKLSLSIFSLPSLSPTRSPQASKKMPLRTIESSLHSSLTSSLSSVLTSPATFSELRPSILASMLSSQSFTLASVFTWPSSRFTRMRASSPAFVASSSQVLLNITTLSTIHVDSVNQMVSSSAKLSLSIFSLPSLSPTRSPQASKKMPLRTIESSLHSSLTSSLSSMLTSPATFSGLRPSLLASTLLPSISVSSSLSPGSSSFATSQFSVSQSSSFSRNALSSVIIISSMSSVIPTESVALRTKPGLSATLPLFSAISSQSSPQHHTPRLVSYGRSEITYLSSQTIQNNTANMTSAKISQKTQTNSVSSSIIPHQPIIPNDTRILMLNFSLLNEVFHSDLSNESSMRRMNLSQRVHFTLWSLFNTALEGFKDIQVIQFRNGSVKVDSELRVSSHSSVIPDHVRQTLLGSNGTNREGFIFDKISVKELCTPGFCMNLGSCQQDENGANCSCINGFFGIRCLQKASDRGAVNGNYAEWTDFSECSQSCKGGQRSRRRTCTNPPPRNGGKDCNELGPDVEYADCNSAVQCSISTEILVVVGVSCSVFLVLLILVIFCFLKRRRKQTDQTNG